MADHGHEDTDAFSGVSTTGHEWDGIRELNNPLPRWWLWTFYACIVWAFGYWLLFPAWPLVSTYSQGLLGWNSRSALAGDLAALRTERGALQVRLAATPIDEVLKSPELFAFAQAQGRAAFGDNCAPCHGAGAAGGKGFPNLNDDDWLWGGATGDIATTLTHGIRWTGDDNTRPGTMPAFGRDGLLKRDEIAQVADYVRSLAGMSVAKGADLARGAAVFAASCAVCHGETGKGNRELGAPNLTDAIWLYGDSKEAIADGLWNGRAGVMPAWGGRLDETTIKAITVYVHGLGGGQ